MWGNVKVVRVRQDGEESLSPFISVSCLVIERPSTFCLIMSNKLPKESFSVAFSSE